MSVRKTAHSVESLARDVVTTTVSAVRHPVGTAALTAGLVRGSVRAARGLFRGEQPTPTSEPPVPVADEVAAPVVLEAVPEQRSDDEPLPETGESFHTEPTASTRDSAHRETGGDLEDAAGYVDEIPDPAEEAAWSSETPVADDGEPLLDEGTAHAIESESAMMQKASDVHKG